MWQQLGRRAIECVGRELVFLDGSDAYDETYQAGDTLKLRGRMRSNGDAGSVRRLSSVNE